MMKISLALVGALLLAATGCSDDTPAGTESELRAELSKLRERIAEAKQTAQRYEGGHIGEVAAMRREVLLLSAAMLESRLIADESGTPTEIVVPTITSNPSRAKQLLRYISATEEEIEQAKKEAADREGVAAKLAQTTVVTHELTLAQLQLAFYQSAFGLALSGEPASIAVATGGTPTEARASGDIVPAPAPRPSNEASGETTAATREEGTVDPLSERAENPEPSGKDVNSSGEAPAPGAPERADRDNAETEISALRDSARSDDTKSETTGAAPSRPAAKHYGREDYVRIQLLLQEAGFNPGTIDGRWGPRSRSALADFQRARGLSPSGRPDPVTLDTLGFN